MKPQTLVPQNFLGNYRGYSEETWFLGIFSFNRVNQAAKYFAKIELMISEEIPTDIVNISEKIPTDNFRRTPHFIRSSPTFFPISLRRNLSFSCDFVDSSLLPCDLWRFLSSPAISTLILMYEPYPTLLG